MVRQSNKSGRSLLLDRKLYNSNAFSIINDTDTFRKIEKNKDIIIFNQIMEMTSLFKDVVERVD